MRGFLNERRMGGLIAFLVLLVALALGGLVVSLTHKVNNVSEVAKQVARDEAHGALHASSLQACHRSNQLRVSLNTQDSHIYDAFAAVAALEKATAQAAPSGKIVNQRAYQLRLKIEERAAEAIPAAASGIQYLPPTDCALAFARGSTYRPPAAISWAQHLHNLGGPKP